MSTPFQPIDVHQFKQRLDEGWEPYVLDVRGHSEAEVSSFDFVDLLEPHTSVASIADELPRDRDILVHCRSGGRSAHACRTLAQLGFSRLWNLEGGINGWASEIDTSMKVY